MIFILFKLHPDPRGDKTIVRNPTYIRGCATHIGLTLPNNIFASVLLCVTGNCVQELLIYEPLHGKTNTLHRRKQRSRSASQ